MKKLLAIGLFILVIALMSGTAFSQAQYLINGENPLAFLLDTGTCQTVSIVLDPGGVIDTPLHSAGCGINYDVSQVLITNVVVADAVVGGPWDPAFTSAIPDAAGPGTYMVGVANFDNVPIDNPIPICDVEFCCQGPGVSEIDIITGYGFSIVVGDSTVWDSQIANGIIDLTQFAPACSCDIAGPATVGASVVDEVTAQYTVDQINPGECNPSAYVWSSDCTLATIDQTGLLTVPATTVMECCTITVIDTANTDINTGDPAECCRDIVIEEGG